MHCNIRGSIFLSADSACGCLRSYTVQELILFSSPKRKKRILTDFLKQDDTDRAL